MATLFDRSVWLEQRTKGIGGSDAAVIIGASPYKSPYRLYLEKRGELLATEEETESMRWGTLLEETIAREYAARTERKIQRCQMQWSKEHPFMYANIDRKIVGDPRGLGVLEIKSFSEYNRAKSDDASLDHVRYQAQHYMVVMGTQYRWASVSILFGGNKMRWFDFDRDDVIIRYLVQLESEFWQRVQDGNPPPLMGHPDESDTVKGQYPSDNGEAVFLPDTALGYVHHLLDVREQIKCLEADKDADETQLKTYLGEAAEGIIPGFGSVTWKQAKPTVKTLFDVDSLKTQHPDIYAKFATSETIPGSRRFLLKPAKGD